MATPSCTTSPSTPGAGDVVTSIQATFVLVGAGGALIGGAGGFAFGRRRLNRARQQAWRLAQTATLNAVVARLAPAGTSWTSPAKSAAVADLIAGTREDVGEIPTVEGASR